MAPDLGIASKATMGCGAKRTREASKARSNPNTRNVRLAGLPPELASSHHGSHGQSRVQIPNTRHGPGAPGGTCPLRSSTGRRPGQTSLTRPPHGREGKRALTEPSHSLASLSQTSQPPAFWKQHRRPTLSAPRLPTCQLGPALPFVTLINCSAAQLSRSRSHGKHHQGLDHDA